MDASVLPPAALALAAAASSAPGLFGAAGLLLAGAREKRGDLDRSRLLARRGGLLMAFAALPAAGFAWLAAGGRPPLAPPIFLAAGLAGLLSGLSGKPRPTGQLAAALHLAGTAAAAWALTSG